MNASGNGGTGKGVQSIEVGYRLIRILMDAAGPMSLKMLAANGGMSPSKAHSYLVSFRRIGLVDQDVRNGQYYLGPFAVEIGIAGLARQNPLQIADRAIHNLRERRPQVSTFISIWTSNGPVIVARGEGNDAIIPFEIRVGYRSPLLHTATGRVFLAHMERSKIAGRIAEEMAAPPPGASDLDSAQLDQIVARILAEGHAIVSNGLLPGLSGVAVPVFGHDGRFGAVLTAITSSATRPEDDLASEMMRAVRRALSSDSRV